MISRIPVLGMVNKKEVQCRKSLLPGGVDFLSFFNPPPLQKVTMQRSPLDIDTSHENGVE